MVCVNSTIDNSMGKSQIVVDDTSTCKILDIFMSWQENEWVINLQNLVKSDDKIDRLCESNFPGSVWLNCC
jgi:hypothetical protein